ncbi:hypothetical protein [Serratia proteamaculans]
MLTMMGVRGAPVLLPSFMEVEFAEVRYLHRPWCKITPQFDATSHCCQLIIPSISRCPHHSRPSPLSVLAPAVVDYSLWAGAKVTIPLAGRATAACEYVSNAQTNLVYNIDLNLYIKKVIKQSVYLSH